MNYLWISNLEIKTENAEEFCCTSNVFDLQQSPRENNTSAKIIAMFIRVK